MDKKHNRSGHKSHRDRGLYQHRWRHTSGSEQNSASPYLLEKVDQLENYSRRNNNWIRNHLGGCEGKDLVKFLTAWLPSILSPDIFDPIATEWAHKALLPKPPWRYH